MRIQCNLSFLLIAFLILLQGCKSTKINHPNEVDYSIFLIPIVRPSSYGDEFVTKKALKLHKEYRINNVVSHGILVSDERWKKYILTTLGIKTLNWDYTAESFMKVSFRRVHGLGTFKWSGNIKLVVNGKEYGYDMLVQNGNIEGYLNEMKELGIYIPFL